MVEQYEALPRAALSFDYLHTNSTTHEFLFGALAELIDNARDAEATKINIFMEKMPELRGERMICFLDDGEGMSPSDACEIMTFGKSSKKATDASLIGMYGNGLKSGSMRIGNDLVVFTKKGPAMTCVLVSRTFHEQESIDEIIVPMPSFDSATKKPLTKTNKDTERHAIEMGLILKYSPFKSLVELMKQFDRIEGKSGTMVCVYNLKLLDNGEPELDLKTDPYDILLTNPEGMDYDTDEGKFVRLIPERRSFRAYTSLLYVDPRMRIYIQDKKVRTKRLVNSLYKPRIYKYSSNRFKTRSEKEAKKADEEAKAADMRAREAESKARNSEKKFAGQVNKEMRAETRKLQQFAVDSRKEANFRKQVSERKQRSLREPKTISFIFGMNITNRKLDGMFVYNCSRLIKMYQRVGPQGDGGVFCCGVIGIVDVPYLVLEPTHNKQDFADAKEYRHLQRVMGEHMVQYWKDLGITSIGVGKFWDSFGYEGRSWRDLPSDEAKYIRKRSMQVQSCLQCDLCLKWRMLPFSSSNIGKVFPDDWTCSNNPDSSHNRCSAPEERPNIPEGQLKKSQKKELTEEELEADIKKKQSKLNELQQTKKKFDEVDEDNEGENEEEEEEDEEEVDEDEVEEEVVKKEKLSVRNSSSRRNSNHRSAAKRHTVPVQPKRVEATSTKVTSESRNLRRRAKIVASSSDDLSDSEPPRKRHAESTLKTYGQSPRKERSSALKTLSSLSAGTDDGSEDEIDTTVIPQVASQVKAQVQGKWYTGEVTLVNEETGKCKVKFDKYSKDKYDKWYGTKSSEIKVLKSKPQALLSEGEKETPSSSTQSASAIVTEDISNGYRTCLRYFLPPQWVMDKEAVSTLSVQELAVFPLDDFFDHYEKGLRKLVSSFQADALAKQHECETSKNKLSRVRRLIARLLKSINDEFEIDPEADDEQVDDLLEACVQQAQQQQEEEQQQQGQQQEEKL